MSRLIVNPYRNNTAHLAELRRRTERPWDWQCSLYLALGVFVVSTLAFDLLTDPAILAWAQYWVGR